MIALMPSENLAADMHTFPDVHSMTSLITERNFPDTYISKSSAYATKAPEQCATLGHLFISSPGPNAIFQVK